MIVERLLLDVDWGGTLAVLAGSAVVSGVVTTLLSGRHERVQHIREQMIEASSAFAQDASGALDALRALDPLMGSKTRKAVEETRKAVEQRAMSEKPFAESSTSETLEELYETTDENISKLGAQRGRIAILFGPTSPPALLANQLIVYLGSTLYHARAGVDDPSELHVAGYTNGYSGAKKIHDEFVAEAGEALRWPLARGAPVWMRAYRWCRARWRGLRASWRAAWKVESDG
jgi:hypothetical protein